MITARSSGEAGDLILGLPVIKHYGSAVLYLSEAQYTRVRWTWERWQVIVSLLKAQPYISDVKQWTGQQVTINLDDFRSPMNKALRQPNTPYRSRCLTDWMLETHGCPLSAKDEPWITVEPRREASVVFARSPRYHNPLFPWPSIVSKYGKDAVFVGLPEEYDAFSRLFGTTARYVQTPDLLECARVIAGCDMFIGNQSSPHALAESMKKQVILECWENGPNTRFIRKGVIHGIYDTLYRPLTDTQ